MRFSRFVPALALAIGFSTALAQQPASQKLRRRADHDIGRDPRPR
jgi:hypothetical protein